MKLFIAEKPSMGRAIAAALPKPHKNNKGYIEAGNGDIVSWCIGHLLEQAEPEDYRADYKKWSIEHLPIVPEQWQLKPISRSKAQFSILKKLVKQATQLVHAGDPDREGQLLVDELIDYLKPPKALKQNTLRLLVNDLNTKAIAKALTKLRPNRDFMALSISALARSRADWLYGINLTRAYTLQGQKSGYNSVLSVGRVQTPLLGLVVERDQEIEHFTPTPYYQVYADIKTSQDTPLDNQRFIAKWQPSEHCQPYMDADNRVLNKGLAENVVKRITGQPATVTDIKTQDKLLNAPLPYNLSSLQIDAAKRFSMNAKMVLDVCQNLYEKYQLITYPRSDCRYLPEEQFSDVKSIVNTLKADNKTYSLAAQNSDTSIKSRAWSNSKVGAHHAIIPTGKANQNTSLNTFEKNIYQLIVTQYLMQFYPPHRFQETKVTLEIAGGCFITKSKQVTQLGWKQLLGNQDKKPNTNKELNEQNTALSRQFHTQSLPKLKQGQKLWCQQGLLDELITKPPQHFTDATLLAAMTNIARFVKNPNIKSILKETDGLGTEATRAGIIELLFKRQYLKREGKSIKATEVGKTLINALPKSATLPDMTAHWEASLTNICNQQQSYQQFMMPLTDTIHAMVGESTRCNFGDLPKVDFKPKRKSKSWANKKGAKGTRKYNKGAKSSSGSQS